MEYVHISRVILWCYVGLIMTTKPNTWMPKVSWKRISERAMSAEITLLLDIEAAITRHRCLFSRRARSKMLRQLTAKIPDKKRRTSNIALWRLCGRETRPVWSCGSFVREQTDLTKKIIQGIVLSWVPDLYLCSETETSCCAFKNDHCLPQKQDFYFAILPNKDKAVRCVWDCSF